MSAETDNPMAAAIRAMIEGTQGTSPECAVAQRAADDLVVEIEAAVSFPTAIRAIANELVEAARYVHSCPQHVAETMRTSAFRLKQIADGKTPRGC